MEGSLDNQGDRLRLLLTLIDTKTMRQVETIALDGQRGSSWQLQDAALTRLANAMNLHLQSRYAREQQEMSPVAPGHSGESVTSLIRPSALSCSRKNSAGSGGRTCSGGCAPRGPSPGAIQGPSR